MDNLNEIKETLKDMFKAAITNAKDGDEKGEWITINGTHVFIPEGKTAEDVIKEKGWKEKGEGKEKSDKSQDKGSESELSKLSDDEINEKKGLLISKIATAQRLDQQDKLKELDKEYDAIVKEQNKRLKSDKQGSEGKKEIKKIKLNDTDKSLLKEGNIYTFARTLMENYPDEVKEAGMKSYVNEYKKFTEYDKENKEFILRYNNGDKAIFDTNLHLKTFKSYNDNSIQNGLSEIIKNCKPETEEDLKVLKGLKDILEQ